MIDNTIRIRAGAPALILAPMDGLTDAPMRALQGEAGGFTFAVSEFLRVSGETPPKKVFLRHVPELLNNGCTPSGLPVQVQLLGGHAGRMAAAAATACDLGARAIDINFGCPAPTVNRHDGGATLLKYPDRIREIVAAVRAAVPSGIPVSAKLRLGWDSPDAILANAAMAEAGGASWIAIHGRTKMQGYRPPALWGPIGEVRGRLSIPVVANGDLWSIADVRRCREETGCEQFMLGRGAIASPSLVHQAAHMLGIGPAPNLGSDREWVPRLLRLAEQMRAHEGHASKDTLGRLKQWLKLASRHGSFTEFDAVKCAESVEELIAILAESEADYLPLRHFSRPLSFA